jgi:hypothetical protein
MVTAISTVRAGAISGWGGAEDHTRCANHVLNLVAKSLLKIFEAPKTESADSTLDKDLAAAEAELVKVSASVEVEDLRTQIDEYTNTLSSSAANDADEDVIDAFQLVDEPAERVRLRKELIPVQKALVKVSRAYSDEKSALTTSQIRRLSFKIVHSTTILLPAWKKLLAELKMTVSMLPRDVSTRWNSTFDMLDAAIEKRAAVDKITGDKENQLRDYELLEAEWKLLEELREVLSVGNMSTCSRAAE